MAHFCGNCGTEFSTDAQFCTGCGRPREQSDVPAADEGPTVITPSSVPAKDAPVAIPPVSPAPAGPGMWEQGGSGLRTRLAIYVAVALVLCGGIIAFAAVHTPTVPAVPAALVAASHRNETARAAEAKATRLAEQQAENASDCQETFSPLLTALNNIDTDLDVGLSFSTYSTEVDTANRKHATAVDDLGDVTSTCLKTVGVPAESALDHYIKAFNTWNGCISNLYCSDNSIKPKLQAQWTYADSALTQAQAALTALQDDGATT